MFVGHNDSLLAYIDYYQLYRKENFICNLMKMTKVPSH